MRYAISACLCGIPCRYDGKSKPNNKALKLYQKEDCVLICPEVLGGLDTPRTPCEISGGRVIDINGEDKTAQYISGAHEVLKICKENSVTTAILKQRSPSCGSSEIYDGSFSGRLIPGCGICAALLKDNSIKVISEEDL